MADQRYTAKSRAKRIELQYFKRLHPFRRWKLILSIAAPLVAAAALLAYAARGDQRIYMSGPVSTAHAMFATQCSECHRPSGAAATTAGMPGGGAFFVKVSDKGCLRCHDGAVHHDTQAFTPSCASCHQEHKGQAVLARLGDTQCVQCHADLKTDKPTAFATSIRHFASGHPEFAIAVKDSGAVRRVRLDRPAELKDTAQVKLNHQKHLKVGLKGLPELAALRGQQGISKEKDGLQLRCTFCHETDASTSRG
jgi:mono/diheme cytochrome c family protein